MEGTVPKPDLPRANQSVEAALGLAAPHPHSPGTACSLACHSYLLHPRQLPSTAQLWMHSGPTLVNNWLCDLGQGTSFPTPPCHLYLRYSTYSL